jgi:hypothetical protein
MFPTGSIPMLLLPELTVLLSPTLFTLRPLLFMWKATINKYDRNLNYVYKVTGLGVDDCYVSCGRLGFWGNGVLFVMGILTEEDKFFMIKQLI